MAADREAPNLLSVADLRTHIHGEKGTVRAVDGVDFEVREGETVCRITNPFGSVATVVETPFTGLPVGASENPVVHPDNPLCHLVKIGAERVRTVEE